MKKKLNRRSLLLSILLVILCSSLTGCETTTDEEDISKIETSFENSTITVSSSSNKTITFQLYIELERNSIQDSFTTGNLAVTGTAPQYYNLKNLLANYITTDSKIISVTVKPATIEDWYADIAVAVWASFAVGVCSGCALVLFAFSQSQS